MKRLLFLLLITAGCGNATGDKGFPLDEPEPDMPIVDMTVPDMSDMDMSKQMQEPVENPQVQLGYGDPFEAFIPGGTLELVLGFQGGWHFDLRLHLAPEAIIADAVAYKVEAFLKESDESIANIAMEPNLTYWVAENGGWSGTFPPVITSATEYPTEWLGQDVILTVEATLGNGQKMEQVIEVFLVDDVE